MEIKKFHKLLKRSIKLNKSVLIVGHNHLLDNLNLALLDILSQEEIENIRENVSVANINVDDFEDSLRGKEYGCVIGVCYLGLFPESIKSAVNSAVNSIGFGRNSEDCTSVFHVKINL